MKLQQPDLMMKYLFDRSSDKKMVLDLTPGQKIRLCSGHNCADCGQETLSHIGQERRRRSVRGEGRVICYSSTQRGYELEVEGVKMLLGYWWIQDCIRGGPAYSPVVNCNPKIIKE